MYDVDGGSLETVPMTYRLYVKTSLTPEFSVFKETSETTINYTHRSNPVCGEAYVTAVRNDAYVESERSDIVAFCTDDEGELTDDGMENYPQPNPPGSFTIEVYQ